MHVQEWVHKAPKDANTLLVCMKRHTCKRSHITHHWSVLIPPLPMCRTERRYAWFRKRLKAREEVWAIFPAAWKAPLVLTVTFCRITKTQLAEILDLRVRYVIGRDLISACF